MEAQSINNTPLSADVTNSATDPNRIEIKTLIQFLDTRPEVTAKLDKEFADALNAGWEILDLQITSSRVGTSTEHMRFVTLQMLIEPEAPSEPEKKVEAAVEALIEEATPEPTDAPAPAPVEAPAQPAVEPVLEPMTISLNGQPVKHVSGVIINDGFLLDQERKPLDEVSFLEALKSGNYTEEEVLELGTRQAMNAAAEYLEARQRTRAPQTWESFLRLPQTAQ